MKQEYIIIGSYNNKSEEIDSFETLDEAQRMLEEYRTAYGQGWSLWILTDAKNIYTTEQELKDYYMGK